MKNKKIIFLSASLIFFFSFSVLNFIQVSEDNQSLEYAFSSLVKTAKAQGEWQPPKDDGNPVQCAITTGNPGGEFLYLICDWEKWSCLYGYEAFVRLDTCYYLG